MSVLTKGLAMDFVRQGKSDMAITSVWPAVAIESAATEFRGASDPSAKKDIRKPVGLLLSRLSAFINTERVRQFFQTPS